MKSSAFIVLLIVHIIAVFTTARSSAEFKNADYLAARRCPVPACDSKYVPIC